jgi:TonB family protein
MLVAGRLHRACIQMVDPFLESRIRDLIATAQQQLSSGWNDAALATLQSARAALDDALSLDRSNATALRLRSEVMAAMERAHAGAQAVSVPPVNESGQRAVRPPSFPLLKEGDAPLFESGTDLIGIPRGGYLPEEEVLSILDEKPHPEPPDYLRVAAIVAAVILVAIAGRVAWYYATNRVDLGTSPLEKMSQTAPVVPPAAPADPNAPPSDDTIYYAGPDIKLPVLLAKSAPHGKPGDKVVLLVVISPAGRPRDARVLRGMDPDTNVSALRAAGNWKFRPGTKDGKPVPVLAQLEIESRN